jgi:tetratricopeptide (TPR) repeat protein
VAESLAAFRQASALDPLSPGFHLGQAYALEALARSGAPDQMEAAWREAQRAVALAPQDPNFHVLYGFFALRNATFDVAVSECERTVELQPFEVSRYCSLGEAYFAAGQYMLHEGRPEAREYLLKTVGVGERLATQAAKVFAFAPAAGKEGQPQALPASVPMVALWAGKAQAFLGDYPEAARLLGEAHDSPLCAAARETPESVARRKAEAAFWLGLVQEKLGDAEAARGYFDEARAGNRATDALIQELRAWLGRAGGGGA